MKNQKTFICQLEPMVYLKRKQTKNLTNSNFLHFFSGKSGDIRKKIIQLIKIKNKKSETEAKSWQRSLVLMSLLSLRASLKAGD